MPDQEHLQFGRAPKDKLPKNDIWDDPWWGTRAYRWWKKQHAANKRRIAAMTPGRRLARRLGVIGTWILAVIAAMSVAAVILFYSLSDVPRPEDVRLEQVATLLYADGSVMARLGDTNRTIVKLDKVPEHVRWAVLAAEDRRFYQDPGVSVRGTLRAALSDLTGGDTQGGSGITQQYAKNAYLGDARTLSRKLKELAIAIKLTREYTKDEIFEFYLNTVYFGRGAWGIEAAATTYFGKHVSQLNTAQGALLAALLRAPGYYDPANDPEAARARWRYVVDGMVATHHLTPRQKSRLHFPKVRAPRDNNGLGATGPTYFIWQQVKAELARHGISEDEIYGRGLRIKTTIDRSAQDAAMQAISQTFAYLTPEQRNLKNALVAVNPTTGAIIAYYGGPNGRAYNGKPDYIDYAGYGSRPPGSSFKPYTLATVLTQTMNKTKDKPRLAISSYVDGSYCKIIEGTEICNDPGNRGVSSGSVTIANAMKYSLNTTFDMLASQAGPAKVAEIAHRMGISKTNPDGRPTLRNKRGRTTFGIGIGDYPVTPLDQAVGFATLANSGMRHDRYFVEWATDSNKSVAYRHKPSGKRALDPEVANDVTLTLQPIPAWSHAALSGGRVAAAKTGTTGIPGTTDNSDAWMVGYTPQVSAAVWVGSGNSTIPIYNAYGGPEYGSDLPSRTWKLFMDLYHADKPFLPMATSQQVLSGFNAVAPPPKPTPSPTKTKPTTTTSASPSDQPTSASPSPPTVTSSDQIPSPTATVPTLPSDSCTPIPLDPACEATTIPTTSAPPGNGQGPGRTRVPG